MAHTFLLLEILNPEVNAFLWAIQEILTGSKPKGPVYITLRGPYEGRIPTIVLRECEEILRYDVLRIFGVGRFSNPDEEIVFFRVDSPNLRLAWWKPEYPIGRHGFEPHISVYRGKNNLLAERAVSVLSKSHINLLCAEHQLVQYSPKQLRLFSEEMNYNIDLKPLIENGRIDASIFENLRNAINSSTEASLGKNEGGGQPFL